MGQAKRRLELAAVPMVIDFSKGAFSVAKLNREAFEKEYPELSKELAAQYGAAKLTIINIAASAYGPQAKVDKATRKIWAAWQEILEEEPSAKIKVTHEMFTWLHKNATKDDLLLDIGLSQWSEALVELLESVKSQEPQPEAS